jgi:DNA-directed RNA polymerase specialized sigma24 family protein
VWRRSSTDPELAAIEIVYRERLQSFVRLATAITGDEQAAVDAVHDGFVRAVRYRSRCATGTRRRGGSVESS